MARFVHTGDWQLGMTRHFLGPDAQPRFTAARIDAVRAIGHVAAEQGCDFVVVSGDVFESNRIDRQVVVRSLEATATIDVPVLLLPGNHDPLDAGSVYRSPTFEQHCPENVVVLESSDPMAIAGVEVVAAPWFTKRPLGDLVNAACSELTPSDDVPRIVVGHGAVDTLSPDPDDPASIRLAATESALAEGRIHYVALGHRHSVTRVGASERIWYSGTPEVTDYVEDDPGNALVVDLTPSDCRVEPHRVGTWSFVKRNAKLNGATDVEQLGSFLAGLPDKERTVVKLSFVGSLSLRDVGLLDDLLDHHRDLFAALETWERSTDLAVLPDAGEFGDLDLTGFALETLTELREQAMGDDGRALVARDALGLLYRLAGGAR